MSERIDILLDRLPPYKGRARMVKRRQNTDDIKREVLNKHISTMGHYDAICQPFWKGSAQATAENLYYFLKRTLPYQAEPTLYQTVKTPAAMLEERLDFGNDCKHFAGFACGIGEALRRKGYPIKCFYRFASYNANRRSPGHVFAVFVDQGKDIWVDPVPEIGGFNRRAISPVFKQDKMPPMSRNGSSIGSLYDISGVRVLDNENVVVSGLAPINVVNGHWLDTLPTSQRRYESPGLPGMGKAKKKHKGLHIKVKPGKLLKKLGGAPIRNAFLALLKINFASRATKIFEGLKKPGFKEKLYAMWAKAGGNSNKLSTAINQGVKWHNKVSHRKVSGMSIGIAPAVAAPALIAAAAPLLAALGNLFKSFGLGHGEDAVDKGVADADLLAAKDHNEATDTKGDGKADVNADGSVDHGDGVKTKVTTDPATGEQVMSYDVKENAGAAGDDEETDTKTKTVTKTKTKTSSGGDDEGGFLQNVNDFVNTHKTGVAITGTGVVALLVGAGIKKKSPMKTMLLIGGAGATAIGGFNLFKK